MKHWYMVAWVFLVACFSGGNLLGAEPFDPRTGLCCSEIETHGTAQGGEVGVNLVSINSSPVTVKTQPQETAQVVMARLAEALRSQKQWIVDVVGSGNVLRIYNTSNGDLYFRSSDPGITSGHPVGDLRSSSDPGTSTATLTWQLPDPRPDAIYVQNSAGKQTRIDKDANQYVYAYPAGRGLGCWFFVTCGYASSSDRTGITRYSDLCQVWVDNPHEMTSRELEIVVEARPLSPFLDREYSAALVKMGGTNPCVWAVTEGALPPGLTMDSLGRIKGVPTQEGRFSFTVKVRDAAGAEVTAAFELEPVRVKQYKLPKQ